MNNICFVNQFANTPDSAGHTRQYEIANYFSKKGYNVQLYASDFNLSKRKFTKIKGLKLIKKENIDNIDWYWLKVISYKKNNYRRILNQISFCLNLIIILGFNHILQKKRIEIIYASSPQLPAAFISFLFSKLIGIPFILEIRDLWPQVLIDQNRGNQKSIFIFVLSILENILYKYSDKIITLSKNSKEYIQNKGGKNITWLPNGPELKYFKYSELPKEENKFSLKRPFKILYTGAHGESNDLNNIIETAKLLKELPIKFIFVGDGPEKFKLIESAKDMNNVIFKDPIPKKNIPLLLKEADAILISLKDIKVFKYGISPNKLYDAYAIGRPIISTVEGSVNEEINKYNIGVTCKPGAPKSLANSIKKLLNLSRKERTQMGKNGRLLAETIYSREIINQKLEDIIRKFNF